MTYAEIARPEDIHLVREEIVAGQFLAGYREPTRGLYRIALRQWFEWCALRGLKPLEVERVHIEVWARELEEVRGLMVSTVAGKLNVLSAFYRRARRDKLIPDNPCEYLKRPTVPRVSSTKGLTRSELLHCLDIAEGNPHPVDHALWCFLSFNGPRVGEALALNVEDMGRLGGYRTIRMEREKGNRGADIPLAPRTSWAFDNYLGTRTTGPLFLQRDETRMDRKGADRIVKRVVKQAGIEKKISPHSLRHTHITLALNAGVTVRDLTDSMGYADSRQINYYDRDKDSLQRNATHMVSAFVEGS